MDGGNGILARILKGFLAELQDVRGLSPNTVMSYRRDVMEFIKSAPENAAPADAMTFQALRRHMSALRVGGRQPRTLARKAAALRAFGDFLVERGYCGSNPARELSTPRQGRRLPVHLTQKEVAARQDLSLPGAKARVQRGRAMMKERLLECCRFEFDHRGGVVDYEPKGPCCARGGGECTS